MTKVLVTGADGFIGSHLVERLVKDGHSVRAFCFYNSFNHSGWLSNIDEKVKSQIEFVYGDIRDAEFVRTAVKGCPTIFHLSSLIAIPYSYKGPRSYVETNVIGALNVLVAALEYGASVIHTSTSEVYGTAQYVPIDEKHPLNAQSPYAATKTAADQLALSYYASFELPVAVVRPFNTFGPRQSARAIIPTIVMQLLSGNRELSLGNLESTRDFTYVDDTVSGILAFKDNEAALGKVINLGTGYEISIKDLALEIGAILNKEVTFNLDSQRLRPTNSEVMQLCSNNQLAKSMLNWQPVSDNLDGLRAGLTKTIDWFSKYDGLIINQLSSDFIY